jgi:hypothetical protein
VHLLAGWKCRHSIISRIVRHSEGERNFGDPGLLVEAGDLFELAFTSLSWKAITDTVRTVLIPL